MLNINEEELKKDIVRRAADQIVDTDADLRKLVRKEVERRLDAIFVDRAEAQIAAAIDEAIKTGFDREYCRVSAWGEQQGETTSIRKELEKTISSYWSASVNRNNGKLENGSNSIARAEYLMTQICAEDFSVMMRQNAANIAGHLKDGLRGQMSTVMDKMLDDLFRVKSLQDQGKVEKR